MDSQRNQARSTVKLTAETLSGIEFFRTLSAADRQALADHCQGRRYEPDQSIVSHGEKTTDVYFIVSGQVRATIYSQSGKEISFRDLGAGQMFGDLSAIDGEPRSANVVALMESLIITMPANVFWQALREHAAVAEVTLRELVNLVRRLSERVVEFSTLGVKNRIHAELLRLAHENMQDENTAAISPAPTHADIASRVSTHREAVTRELNQLAQSGLIERRSGTLIICDVPQLARMVQEVRGE